MSKKNTPNSLFVGLSLFLFAFLVSRAQFFACPLVEIQNDSGEYIYWIDAYLSKGEMPPNNYIPIGYPLIVKALTVIHDSVYTIVYFQFAFTFLSFCILLFIVWRLYDKKIYYISLFCLIAYVQVPNNLFYDIYLLSESCYNSSLVLLVAALVAFFNQPTKRNSVLLSFALATPVLFRPTGIFTLVLFVLLILHLIFIARNEILPAFIFPFFCIYLTLSAYSFAVSNDPIFIGHKRVTSAISNVSSDEIPAPVSHRDSVLLPLLKMNLLQRTIHLYQAYAKQSQMYTRIEEASDKYFKRDFPKTNEWSCCYYGWVDSSMVKERKAIFKEFYDTDKMKYLVERESEIKKTKLFKLYDVFSIYIIKKIFLSPFWIILMFGSFFAAVVLSVFEKFRNPKTLLLIFIILVNIGTATTVIVAGHLPIFRYSYPGEFIFLLHLPFLIDLIRDRINAFR